MAMMLLAGCAHLGMLKPVSQTISPVASDSSLANREERRKTLGPWRPLFSDTLIGLVPGTADSSRRYLGRLRDGYTSDTLNLMLFGDNRPGWRAARLAPEYATIQRMFSPSPINILRGLVTIPWAIGKGLWPDLALLRDLPDKFRNMPVYGREREVIGAMLAKIDSLKARGQTVAAVVNSGDLVEDGRYPAHWERFLRITQPLSSRVPYFGVPGNHERTDAVQGVQNWGIATGLPVGGDRLYYCFDTADGWLRVIALDSNPIVDPGKHWSREVQIKYSQEEFTWLVERVKEHRGPVIVLMHHPPFSSSLHREEWQRDSVLTERRERMVGALHDAGISAIVCGHEHAYQRALLTWPDAVAVVLVTGGAGAPLHQLPPPAEVARLFSEYKVAGSIVKPENVFSAEVFNFVHMRLWFGGGEFYTYAVDQHSKATLIDKVEIDLKRYGIPKIDQHKIPIPPAKGPQEPPHTAIARAGSPATMAGMAKSPGKVDTTTASKRILSKPSPSGKSDSTSAGKRVLSKPSSRGMNSPH
jgi:3',5'-cyclic AMP phosphodiesterase CpdA